MVLHVPTLNLFYQPQPPLLGSELMPHFFIYSHAGLEEGLTVDSHVSCARNLEPLSGLAYVGVLGHSKHRPCVTASLAAE